MRILFAVLMYSGTHEFGHGVGMGHSAVLDATMYPSTVFCNKNIRTLAPDDVAGISKLYGHN